jgi:hypothetical protein
MRRLAIAAAFLTVLVLAPLAYPAHSSAPACGYVAASFRVVPGSAGAGNIVYRLRVHNGSKRACAFAGFKRVKLLSRTQRPLPTRAHWAESYGSIDHLLAPGQSLSAEARFSPDVPGVGEGNRRRCEPVARFLLLERGQRRQMIRVAPATSVCEHGSLAFSAWH